MARFDLLQLNKTITNRFCDGVASVSYTHLNTRRRGRKDQNRRRSGRADQKDKERVNNMTEEYTIGELEKKIGYQFRDKSLLKQALTHSSFANEQRINKLKDYERLEFLGDAVLELISSDFLFHENPQMPEGKLTKLRSSMVCRCV